MSADFVETMRSLFGFDPTTGATATAPQGSAGPGLHSARRDQIVQPQSGAGGAAPTPEAADPATPSPGGQVLARLRPHAQVAQPAQPQSSPLGGLGSDLSAGVASYDPKLGRGGNLAAGFAAGMKGSESRDAARQQALTDQQKQSIEQLKTLFDVSSKMADQQRQQQVDAASQAHQGSEDAESKRWHDIQHADNIAKNNKDTGAGTDWTTPDNLLNASKLETAKLNELGLDHVTQRNVTKALNDPLTPDDQKTQLKDANKAAQDQFQEWRAQQPWVGGSAKKPAKPVAAPAAPDDEESDTGGASATPAASNPATGAAPAPAATATVSYRKATAPDGSVWLVNPVNPQDRHLASPAPAAQSAAQPAPQSPQDQSAFPLD